MEFTQPLGVGLGLAVRINNQYSHPVCMGRCTDTYTTINNTWEISWEYQLLTRERWCGNSGIRGNRDTVWTTCRWDMRQIELQMMTSCGSCTSQSHKSIAQTNHTKWSHGRQDDNVQEWKWRTTTFGCSRATQVHMEDLRLVNLTEICPSRRGECFKAPC